MKPIPVSILISDPWDLGEALNWASVRGEVVRLEPDQYGGQALIWFEPPIDYRGTNYACAVAKPRHEGHEVMEIPAGAKLCAAFSCMPDEKSKVSDPLGANVWDGGLAFIGDIERAT